LHKRHRYFRGSIDNGASGGEVEMAATDGGAGDDDEIAEIE
jgi:hypothetical protein